jgi:glycosyltransferase involved in cell wall biosynthesis
MPPALVSIITPTYNAEKFIGKALESVQGQTYANWEWIIVNDGGTDDTGKLVADFARKVPQSIQFIEHSKSLGPSAARNTAMNAAKGDYIAFLDADDYWTPEHLENAVGILTGGLADLAYAGACVFRETPAGEIEKLPIDTIQVTNPAKDLFTRNFANPSGVVITRRLRDKVGDFDVTLIGVEDWDYWIRAATQGFKLIGTGKTTYYYRKTGNSLSSVSARMAEGSARIYEKHWRCGILPEAEIVAKARDCHYAAGKLYWRKNPRAASESFYKAWLLNKFRLMPVMAAAFTRFLSWMPSRVTSFFAGR